MPIDVGPESTLDRLEELCDLAHDALLAGLQVATEIHDERGYTPRADPHLFHNLVRREAMEQLKRLNPGLLEHDNLGLAMSGLILPTETDVVRIWHTAEAFIPAPSTDRARAFVRQRPSGSPQSLFDVAEIDTPLPSMDRNHLILQWTENGLGLERLSLVRPIGIIGRPQRVVADWSRNLLPNSLDEISNSHGEDFGDDDPDEHDDW